jgi:hypothetical protein
MRKLTGLSFKFSYKKGSENKVVDVLPRVAAHLQLNVISTVVLVWIQEIVNSYQHDSEATALL